MGQLIDDLLRLSQVTRAELRHERVDLTLVARTIAALSETRHLREMQHSPLQKDFAEGDLKLLEVALGIC